MRPEVPGKSQRTPTGGRHSFGSVQGMRVRCGLVIVDRHPNERQRALLERLAAGEEHPAAWTPGDWRSAYALRDRGLLRVSRGGGEALVEVTEDGRYYLRHGHRPQEPTPAEGGARAASGGPAGRRRSSVSYAERPVARARRAKATELVERLLTEGRVRVADDDQVAEWRKVIDYAKRHGLEPPGKRIEKVRLGAGVWELCLAEGSHPNSRSRKPAGDASAVPVPTRLTAPHPAVAALRDAEKRLVMPPALRRRSLLLLQALAAEAVRRGYGVRENRAYCLQREGGVSVVVDGFACNVTVKQEFPQSNKPERAARLVVELDHGLTSRPGRWRDRKSGTLEDSLGVILGEIEVRAVHDAQRRASEERARAERQIHWQAAMEEAREQAVQDQLAEELREEAGRWREAAVLSQYCDAMERCFGELGGGADELALDSSRRWLAWARDYVRATDPLTRLPRMPDTREPTQEELRPHLKGWSPYGPERRAER